jgi:hypothetical protein
MGRFSALSRAQKDIETPHWAIKPYLHEHELQTKSTSALSLSYHWWFGMEILFLLYLCNMVLLRISLVDIWLEREPNQVIDMTGFLPTTLEAKKSVFNWLRKVCVVDVIQGKCVLSLELYPLIIVLPFFSICNSTICCFRWSTPLLSYNPVGGQVVGYNMRSYHQRNSTMGSKIPQLFGWSKIGSYYLIYIYIYINS